MKKSLLSLLTVMTLTAAQAKVVEIKSYRESLAELANANLVVFDIDNTMLRPVQTLGSDQWFGAREKHWKAQGRADSAATDKAIEEWVAVQRHTKVQVTEASLKSLVASLKSRRIPIMALTARPVELAQATLRQLESLGLDLGAASPWDKNYLRA